MTAAAAVLTPRVTPKFPNRLPQPDRVAGPAYAWDRGECLAMAHPKCRCCFGLGRAVRQTPCPCVCRAIFRACRKKFEDVLAYASFRSGGVKMCAVDSGVGKPGRVYGRRNEEFSADFVLIARRTLTPQDYLLFRLHVLAGLGATQAFAQMKVDRAHGFHTLYRIEALLGRAFRECRPYALFPIEEYFSQ